MVKNCRICKKSVQCHGLCVQHYGAYYRCCKKNPDKKYRQIIEIIKNTKPKSKICRIDGCNIKIFGQGFCSKHYYRRRIYLKKHPDFDPLKNSEELKNIIIHMGQVKDVLKCPVCGIQQHKSLAYKITHMGKQNRAFCSQKCYDTRYEKLKKYYEEKDKIIACHIIYERYTEVKNLEDKESLFAPENIFETEQLIGIKCKKVDREISNP